MLILYQTAKGVIDNEPKLVLTHWGWVMHTCIGNLTIIGSDNGLSPSRRQAIIWTNAGILLIGPLGTNFNENIIEILTFSFTKKRWKVSSAKWRPLCLSLNVLSNSLEPINSNLVYSGGVCHFYWYPLDKRTKYWNWQPILATNFGKPCTKGHNCWQPKFWLPTLVCTRLLQNKFSPKQKTTKKMHLRMFNKCFYILSDWQSFRIFNCTNCYWLVLVNWWTWGQWRSYPTLH